MRHLTANDVASAIELSRLAGWNQVPDDWRRILALSPEGCFCIETEERIVATCTLVCYGQALAWIGMVLTHPDYRRRGFARQLVAHAMDQARQLGIRTIKLDATEGGRLIYEALGFRAEQPVERWVRDGSQNQIETCSKVPVSMDLDSEACGYDRTTLLSPASVAVTGSNGYLMCRPGTLNAYLGPCVARDPSTAEELINRHIKRYSDTGWFWDLLPLNKSAVSLARRLGFQCTRSLTRMVSGPDLRGREEWIYAIAGFELG